MEVILNEVREGKVNGREGKVVMEWEGNESGWKGGIDMGWWNVNEVK